MKNLKYLALVLSFVAFQAEAVIVCKEIETARSKKMEVVIVTLADITKSVSYGHEYDSVTKVKVVVNEVQNGKKTKIRDFVGIAKAEDVNYGISSVRDNGFKLWRYMDEEDQDGMELANSLGEKKKYRLNCVGSNAI
jgi:hypothetical protein